MKRMKSAGRVCIKCVSPRCSNLGIKKIDKLMAMKNLQSVAIGLARIFCPTACCRIGLLDETPIRRLLK